MNPEPDDADVIVQVEICLIDFKQFFFWLADKMFGNRLHDVGKQITVQCVFQSGIVDFLFRLREKRCRRFFIRRFFDNVLQVFDRFRARKCRKVKRSVAQKVGREKRFARFFFCRINSKNRPEQKLYFIPLNEAAGKMPVYFNFVFAERRIIFHEFLL